MLSGTIKETERGWRLMISNSTRGLIAMAFAVHVATQLESVSVYEDDEFLVV